jgi:maleate isomerase
MMSDQAIAPVNFGWRLRIGMILPSSNRVAESEIPAMVPDGVSVHTARLKLRGGSREEVLAMVERVEDAAMLLVDAGVDVIAFHCTGVSTFDPQMEVDLKQRIETVTGIPETATSEALVAAFRTLDAKRVVMVTPYPASVNEREVAFFAHHQISVITEKGLGLTNAADFGQVEPGEWYRLVMAERNEDADAYFLSCTTIRASPIIAALEQNLGKPVITSNQAMAWHALRQGGVTDRKAGFGQLLSSH